MTTERRQRGLLTLTIEGATEYLRADPAVENRRRSPPANLCGVEWTLEAFSHPYYLGPYLAFRIRYAGSHPFQGDWRFNVKCVVRVRNSKAEDVIDDFAAYISKERTSAGCNLIMPTSVSQPYPNPNFGVCVITTETTGILARILVVTLSFQNFKVVKGPQSRCEYCEYQL